jgi:hypothetical protein
MSTTGELQREHEDITAETPRTGEDAPREARDGMILIRL